MLYWALTGLKQCVCVIFRVCEHRYVHSTDLLPSQGHACLKTHLTDIKPVSGWISSMMHKGKVCNYSVCAAEREIISALLETNKSLFNQES